MAVTPAQLRAARAMIQLHVDDLAVRSGVHGNTIQRFEKGVGRPHPATTAALQRTLEAAGVEFIDNGVRLRQG